jgi:hypothetical protein
MPVPPCRLPPPGAGHPHRSGIPLTEHRTASTVAMQIKRQGRSIAESGLVLESLPASSGSACLLMRT